jgi:hypothetical protein
MLVIMALVSTAMAAPLTNWLAGRDKPTTVSVDFATDGTEGRAAA